MANIKYLMKNGILKYRQTILYLKLDGVGAIDNRPPTNWQQVKALCRSWNKACVEAVALVTIKKLVN